MRKTNFPLPVKAVMIDLDGTLLDTAQDLALAVNLTLIELGRPTLHEKRIANFIGKGVYHLMRCALTEVDGGQPDEALFERSMAMFMDCYDRTNGEHTAPYPGVVEGLDALRAAGFPLACVTNKIGRFTFSLLERQRLTRYFDIVLAGDTLPKKKPDPLPLTHTAEKFGVTPCDLLLIGDSLNDVEAARAAGCPVFCVDYGYNEGNDVRAFDVDAIVSSLFEASKLITRSNTKS
ncbi:MAG TPA: phosphoglycolate phosphatase [Burkholderiales bacterium]|nr:phosphoglycolate phosphatase [Burkholderiales bacterium]